MFNLLKNRICFSPDEGGDDWLDDAVNSFQSSKKTDPKIPQKPRKEQKVWEVPYRVLDPETGEPVEESSKDADSPIFQDLAPQEAPESEPVQAADAEEVKEVPEVEKPDPVAEDPEPGEDDYIDYTAMLLSDAGDAERDREAPQEKTEHPVVSKIKIIAFASVMAALFIIGLLIPLRPAFSANEKRTLSAFPEFTWQTFFSGEFFSGIETWYADTFPGRDAFVAMNASFQSAFGFGTDAISPGGSGEDIPDIPDDIDSYLHDLDSETSDKPGQQEQTGESIDGFYVSGDTAYELYYYVQASASRYAKLIADAATELRNASDGVTVYSMIVPLSYSVQLDAQTQQKINVSDAGKAIRYMYDFTRQLNPDVVTISVLDALLSHREEYLYFRTDHHWTALGAYYAFCEYASAAGITPTPLENYTQTRTYTGFLGTLYQKLVQDQPRAAAKLEANPDELLVYVPNGTNDNVITFEDGTVNRSSYGVINRVDRAGAGDKYATFLGGDFPLCAIHNSAITDGSSVLLVKDSFGNAFAPFLVDSYEYVYVIDYRLYTGSLSAFVRDNGVKDVLFLNYIFTTGSKQAERLQNIY